MTVVRLVSWKEVEGQIKRQEMEGLGYAVEFETADPGKLLRKLKATSPAAVVSDLSRSPAQGRDLGVALRVKATTRGIPLVFAGGSPDKVGRIREILPDAGFTEWDRIGDALSKALTDPPAHPIVP